MAARLRVLQINASYKPAFIYGGPTMSVSKLSEQLVKSGIQVQVFTTTANGSAELPIAQTKPLMVDGVPVYYFKRLTKDHSHFSPRLLWAVWKQAKQFDIIHIHAWWNTVSVLACLIALMRGVRVVISPRGTLSNYSFHNKNSFIKKGIHHLLGKQLLNKSNIHVTSPREKLAIDALVRPKQIAVIPNFIELPADLPVKETIRSDKLSLLFLSRIEEKKGLDILIHSLKSIIIPYHLTVAGTGEQTYIDSLKLLAEQQNLTDYITWAGFQTQNKFQMLADNDLFILPSYDENFGNVVIESLSVGTAVLISEQVGLADYVRNNALGYICTTEAISVAEAINQINRQQLDEIREKAPAIIYHDFNEDALAQQYINMYQNTLQHG